MVSFIIPRENRIEFISKVYLGSKGSHVKRYLDCPASKSIRNLNDIVAVLKAIYNAGTPFAKYGQSHPTMSANEPDLTLSVFEPLATMIHAYFSSPAAATQADFDALHERLCDCFITNLDALRARLGVAAGVVTTYGNAQKIVNVCFKYLTCFQDYERYHEWFRFCHIPIDSQILEALGANGIRNCGRTGYQRPGAATAVSWSNFWKPDYDALVADYRNMLIPYLLVDFLVWH